MRCNREIHSFTDNSGIQTIWCWREYFDLQEGMLQGDRTFHNEKLHTLYSSPNIITVINEYEMDRACSTWELAMRNS
jgi:hypothetical protein